MLQITYNDADRILLDMADAAELAEHYNQRTFGFSCGSPACMLGTYAWRHPNSLAHRLIAAVNDGDLGPHVDAHNKLVRELQLSETEYNQLFGMNGCGNAGDDGKRAAAYVREFVRKRAEARIMV